MQWQKVRHVALYEYRTNFRRGGYLFATFGLPLLGALLMLGIHWISQQHRSADLVGVDFDKPIGVLDQAHFLPENLPEDFVWVDDLEAGKQEVLAKRLLALVVIPEGYPTTETHLQFYTAHSLVSVGDVASDRLLLLLAYGKAKGKLPPEAIEDLFTRPQVDYMVLTAPEESQQQNFRDMWGPYTLSILYFMALFSSAAYLLQGVAEEKESRIVEILLSSVNTHELLWGKVLGLGALGLTQLAVWGLSAFAFLRWLDDAKAFLPSMSPQFLAASLAILFVGFLMFGVLMAGLGALGNNMRESQQFSAFVSMLAVVPMMLSSLFIMNPNGLVPRVLSYIPWTAPIALLMRLSFTPLPWWDVLASLLAMLLGVGISVWAGVRLFRVGILMYGKRPTWKEVWRILRQPA